MRVFACCLLGLLSVAYSDPYVWPLPSKYTISSMPNVDLSNSFQITTTSGSQILKSGIGRYTYITFDHTPENESKSSSLLTSLAVTVNSDDEDLQFGVDESYTLSITTSSNTGTLNAATVYGALKGLETFSQLVLYNFTMGYYQAFASNIMDKPRFKWRGILIDTGRHFLTTQTIKKVLNGMEFAKFNVLHWHIVDTQSFPYESKVYPKFNNGAFDKYQRYSQNDMKDIVYYAKERGIRVVPEFDIPGHTMSWCVGYPEICPNPQCNSPNGENDSPDGILNPATNMTYEIIQGLFKEASTIFTDNYQHIGGDETDTACWDKTPSIVSWQQQMGYNDEDTLYYFTKNALNITKNIIKKAVQWDEIYTMFGKNILTNDTTFQVWHAPSLIASIVEDGFNGIFSPESDWYLDHLGITWQTMYSTEPCSEITDPSLDEKVLGGEGCMWGETVDPSDIEQTIWPRALAIAERLWSLRNTTNAVNATPRYAYMRCLLNQRGVAAAPYMQSGRGIPPGPGSCYKQRR